MLPSFMAYYCRSLQWCLNGSSCQPNSLRCHRKGHYEHNMLTGKRFPYGRCWRCYDVKDISRDRNAFILRATNLHCDLKTMTLFYVIWNSRRVVTACWQVFLGVTLCRRGDSDWHLEGTVVLLDVGICWPENLDHQCFCYRDKFQCYLAAG